MSTRWPVARICKTYSFSAAHFLPNVNNRHPCKRMHGHNYRLEIEVRGEVNPETGMVCDFHEVDKAMEKIMDRLDHYTLNNIRGLDNPTAENLAAWVMREYPVKNLYRVRVWETDKCWAEVIDTEGKWPKECRG